MDALGPLLLVVIPVATGAFAWLFYREFLINDRFWIVVVALAIGGTLVQSGYMKEGAVVSLVGIGVWLWMEYRSREEEE